ncbi:quinone-dependent dihydroorotate dehydrogenase [Teichococcus vastitatis]|uniref:Dihydroorotate dehydrogenase (quinone) n=1 Tax=Teichococcus vastitatis TaxID=2307076 RepID=A0ABS9VZM5_9PROT|nr:quinone-dependent dihydroorotate dehydrogenase [Pseudoroseomonas vastitatis]MCI0752465.1 quinone-dependent dihydroorotate dehydrogenase [Pseudoroseomonas vastitatis]
MTPALASALMPLMRGMDPEHAHNLALKALRLGLAGRDRAPDDPLLATEVLGLRFRNPIGLSAGFDKDAVAVRPLMRLGFGFVEPGTTTPRPQAGNPQPRLFRLLEDAAVINRMGMNNEGVAAFVVRLAALRRPLPAVLGANVGINKEGADPEHDYPSLYAAVAPQADYVAINVSSPNTPGLRDLQGEAKLAAILNAVAEVRAAAPRQPPVLVKIAPDLAPEAVAPLVETCIGAGIAGLIVSNTTIVRPDTLRSPHRAETGGLSGQPLFGPSTELLRQVYRIARGRLALIGCGGIATPEQAYAKIRAGADLVQLYAGFALAGPALVPQLKQGLAALLKRDGFQHVHQAVGVDAQ